MSKFELPVQILNLLLKNQLATNINPNDLLEKLIIKLQDYDRIKTENDLLKKKFIQLNSEVYNLSLKLEGLQQVKKKRKIYVADED